MQYYCASSKLLNQFHQKAVYTVSSFVGGDLTLSAQWTTYISLQLSDCGNAVSMHIIMAQDGYFEQHLH